MRVPLILSRQGEVLRASPSFRLLFGSTLISGLGTWIAVIALVVDVKNRTGSAVWVSALLIADFLPGVAIGLLLGPLVDRFSRKRILVGADLTRCAVFVLLALAVNSGQIVALALVAGIASGFARPAAYAGLPNLVPEELLARANSLLRSADQLTVMAGTILGGILVAASGPDLAYWLNAGSFAVSMILVLRISTSLLQKGKVESRGHWHDVAEGFGAIVRSRPLLTVLVSWSIATVTMAVANVAEVFLATVAFDAGSFGYGLMWTASGLGAVIGALFASSWLEWRSMTLVYASAIALMGIGDIAAGVSPNVWVAIWCVLLGGVGNATAIVCNSLLVQRGAPDHIRGRVFTVLIGATSAVLGIGMALTGPLVDEVGPRWAYVLAGGVALVAAATGFVMLRREPAQIPGPAPTERMEPGGTFGSPVRGAVALPRRRWRDKP